MVLDISPIIIYHTVKLLLRIRSSHISALPPFIFDGVPSLFGGPIIRKAGISFGSTFDAFASFFPFFLIFPFIFFEEKHQRSQRNQRNQRIPQVMQRCSKGGLRYTASISKATLRKIGTIEDACISIKIDKILEKVEKIVK